MAFVALWGTPQHAAAELFVVSIGNNHGHDNELPLRFAESDAETVAQVLRRFGGTRGENTAVLLGQPARQILDSLTVVHERLTQLTEAQRQDSTLVVYYSGHADARGLHPSNSTLPYDEIRATVEAMPVAVRILIVDGCRSGGLTRVKGGRAAESFDIEAENRLQTSGFALITSSAASEDSHESDRLGGSFFTHHFTNALRGVSDYDADGRVTLSEAYNYAYQQTLRSSGQTMSLQHPTLDTQIRGRGDVTLTQPGVFGNNTGLLRFNEPGTYLVMRSREGGSVVAELETTERDRSIRLPAGRYVVQRRNQRDYQQYKVSIEETKLTELDTLRFKNIAYAELVRKGGPSSTSNELSTFVGVRGHILSGYPVSPQFGVDYRLHLRWLTLGLRFRASTSALRHTGNASHVRTRATELGLGLTIERYIDWTALSLSFGLWVEAGYLRQHVRSVQPEPTRRGVTGAFGGLVAITRNLTPRLSLRLEGGPLTYLVKTAEVRDGLQVGSKLETPFTWWLSIALGVRF